MLLCEHGVDVVPSENSVPTPEPGRWHEKRYPSLYVPFAERLACIDELWSACPDRLSDARVVDADEVGEIVLHVDRLGRCEEVQTRHLVIATGRWSPLWTRPWLAKLGVKFGFQRDEIGVRIETPIDHALFANLPGVDGKLIMPGRRDGDVEIRTFCTCRDGEVVLAHAEGIHAYSGRADGPKTGRANVGLVVRGRLGDAVERASRAEPIRFELRDWIGHGARFLADTFGDTGAGALWRALELLRERITELDNATVYAPVIEGVGEYPIADGSLQIAPNVWVAGDAGGRFRGIVASMVSGRYVARQIIAAGG